MLFGNCVHVSVSVVATKELVFSTAIAREASYRACTVLVPLAAWGRRKTRTPDAWKEELQYTLASVSQSNSARGVEKNYKQQARGTLASVPRNNARHSVH